MKGSEVLVGFVIYQNRCIKIVAAARATDPSYVTAFDPELSPAVSPASESVLVSSSCLGSALIRGPSSANSCS